MLTHASKPAAHCRQDNSALLYKELAFINQQHAAVTVSCPVVSAYVTATEHYSKATDTRRAELPYSAIVSFIGFNSCFICLHARREVNSRVSDHVGSSLRLGN